MLVPACLPFDMEALGALAIIGQTNAGEYLLVGSVFDLVLDLATEVVGQFLRICGGNDVMVRIAPQIPCREEFGRQH